MTAQRWAFFLCSNHIWSFLSGQAQTVAGVFGQAYGPDVLTHHCLCIDDQIWCCWYVCGIGATSELMWLNTQGTLDYQSRGCDSAGVTPGTSDHVLIHAQWISLTMHTVIPNAAFFACKSGLKQCCGDWFVMHGFLLAWVHWSVISVLCHYWFSGDMRWSAWFLVNAHALLLTPECNVLFIMPAFLVIS